MGRNRRIGIYPLIGITNTLQGPFRDNPESKLSFMYLISGAPRVKT